MTSLITIITMFIKLFDLNFIYYEKLEKNLQNS